MVDMSTRVSVRKLFEQVVIKNSLDHHFKINIPVHLELEIYLFAKFQIPIDPQNPRICPEP